ncbi:MAG: nickel-dependent hydrogenase large subunit [Gammaproteobacteria bacterium SHHR-1]|uniref:nickel-dependent hydrogenase large subunit n=1 Tax=Magnetovirga frankeli TaxID=947516 RepID=UPI0012934CDB|nr:nickel-dependent hydrogenase large subunit [gamma proteobacterium SS-5]
MTPNPAGAIHLQLTTNAERVIAVDLDSSRPTNLSQRLFRGRGSEQVQALVPLVFSVCATAQSVAASQALEQAAGLDLDPAQERARELLLLAETQREHLFRVLLGWSAWLGAEPDGAALGELGRLRGDLVPALYPQGDGFRPGGGRLQPDRTRLQAMLQGQERLLRDLLGLGPADWLGLGSLAEIQAWAQSGDRLAQRFCRQIMQQGLAQMGAVSVMPLPPLDPARLSALLQAEGAAEFVAAPLWQGQVRETGALQRQQAQPLLQPVRQAHGTGLLCRQLARLCELVQGLERMGELVNNLAPARPGGQALRPSGQGLAQVEAARGRLVHWLDLRQGRIADYRILAPTEWNFHPRGVLAQGLMTLPANRKLPQLAQLLVDAIDPCVEARLSVQKTDDR